MISGGSYCGTSVARFVVAQAEDVAHRVPEAPPGCNRQLLLVITHPDGALHRPDARHEIVGETAPKTENPAAHETERVAPKKLSPAPKEYPTTFGDKLHVDVRNHAF